MERSSPKKYVLRTLGCKANLYDSQLIDFELQRRGWVPAPLGEEGSAELCVVNSCTVTDEADKQSRKTAARLSREHPGARVVFTGCGAEVEPEKISRAQGVDFVVSNREKPGLVDLVLAKLGEPRVPGDRSGRSEGGTSEPGRATLLGQTQGYAELLSRHPMDREWPAPESVLTLVPSMLQDGGSRTRAFLKIQEGCNSFCTYCIIPYGRGPSRSLEIPGVVAQVRALVESGVREVVITGTNIGDYGTDWGKGPALVELFSEILSQTDLQRLRVSSLDPSEILLPGLLELMRAEPRFCPHFHVSLQSPHSRVLKLMKRKYGFEQVRECLERIAEIPAPEGGAFVGMDIITGFPGESEEDFEWGYEALQQLPWSRLHVFPYSEREGTPATRLPGKVRGEVRAARAKRLRALSMERMRSHYGGAKKALEKRGGILSGVLLEGKMRGPDGSPEWRAGYTSHYLRVLIPPQELRESSRRNDLVSAMPTELISDPASGEVAFLADLA